MSTDLVRLKLESSLQAPSLRALVKAREAEKQTFLLLDCSGSMSTPVEGSRRRIDALREVVAELRQTLACPCVGFGLSLDSHDADVQPLPGPIPDPLGSTPLAEAIEYGRTHGAHRLIVVSDGEPNSEEKALRAAALFAQPIDVFFVGTPGSRGEAFLQKLARASGGACQTTDLKRPALLTSGIRALLQDPANKG